MIEIGDYKIKQYQHGYEVYLPYQGTKKDGDLETKVTKHRRVYYPDLKSACMRVLDTESGRCDGLQAVISKIDEVGKRIEDAIVDYGAE